MRFWDSSAILPLIIKEDSTARMTRSYSEDPDIVVWWATEVECISAVTRLERTGDVNATAVTDVLKRLSRLKGNWNEVQPVESVRKTAKRLLRVHDLRAADSLQLAAAIEASEGQPDSVDLMTLDDRLSGAARREGFSTG